MPQTWQNQLVADSQALLSADLAGWSETIVRYPLGDTDDPQNVQAIVFLDREEGTNEQSGDGPITIDDYGDKERRTGLLEIDKALAVDDRDTWLIDGQIWATQRHFGRDNGLRGVRIARAEGRYTRLPRLRNDERPR